MFELNETQRMAERAVRGWCEQNLAPAVPALETGTLLPYDLLRRFAGELGVSAPLVATAERRIAKLVGGAASQAESAGDHGGEFGGDPMLTSVLLKEISRISPGFGMAFIATLGCAMAIVMAQRADGAGYRRTEQKISPAAWALALENARNLVFKLAWAQREEKLDARLASLAKLYCAEEAVRVALDAIQIHGGAGYMAELPLEKLMRDAKMFEIGGGTNEIQLQTIARSLLG